MKITAWKCKDTGSIFEHEADYRSHRSLLLVTKRADARETKFINKILKFWKDAAACVNNTDELAEYMLTNWSILESAGIRYSMTRRSPHNNPKANSISFTHITWDRQLCQWKGRIEVEFAGNTKCYLHEFFEYSPLRLEYTPDSSVKQQELGSPQVQLRTVYIPARAFPLMAASQERADVWNILAADNVCNFV